MFKMSLQDERLTANMELTELLMELVMENPDMRFSQILSGFGFIKDESYADAYGGWMSMWRNESNLEPINVLTRVKKQMLFIKEQQEKLIP